jgi:carbonic anhydrase
VQRFVDLLKGFRSFRTERWGEPRFRDLVVKGQSPTFLCIACSDSRVDPALLFDAEPGDLFVVRNIANMVPPHSPDAGLHGVSAAIEYAVGVLAIRHIVVCGHSACGGIQALMDERPLSTTTYVDRWVQLGASARAAALHAGEGASREEQLLLCGRHNVENSVANLRTFPFVAEAEREGRLWLHGLYVRIETGTLQRFMPGQGWVEVA